MLNKTPRGKKVTPRMTIASSTPGPTQAKLMVVAADRAVHAKPATSAELELPNGVSLVPTEDVLLLAVDLPVMASAQRRMAIGYAVEDRIAQTLDEVQVVLGPQMSPGVWLVAVTARSVLAGASKTDAKGVLWPDVLLVPVPRVGWAVWCDMDRVLVRLPDGTGFATSPAALPAFWTAAGSPPVTAYGSVIPAGIPVAERAALPTTPAPALGGFDLRSGLNRTGAGLSLPKAAKRLVAVLLITAVAHLTLLVTDVIALNRIAGQVEGELRTLLGATEATDLDVALAQALAARQPADSGGILSFLSRAFGAIEAEAGRVSVQNLRYTAAEDTAVLSIEAPDLATLQAVETALTGAALTVTAGAAITSDGGAEVQLTIRGGGA